MTKKNKNRNIIGLSILAIAIVLFVFATISFTVIESNDGFILLKDTDFPLIESYASPDYFNSDIEYSFTPFPSTNSFEGNLPLTAVNGKFENTESGITTSSTNVYVKKEFEINQADLWDVWMLITFKTTSTTSQVPILNEISCTLNGNEFTGSFTKTGHNSVSNLKYHKITNKIKNGSNVLICSKTAVDDSDFIDIEIAQYKKSDGRYKTENGVTPEFPTVNILNSRYGKTGIWKAQMEIEGVGSGTYGVFGKQAYYSSWAVTQSSISGSENAIKLHADTGSWSSSSRESWVFSSATFTPEYDLTSGNFRADLEINAVSQENFKSTLEILLGNELIYSESFENRKDTILFESVAEPINPNLVKFNVGGIQRKELNLINSTRQITFKITSGGGERRDRVYKSPITLTIKKLRFQPLFSCQIPDNHLLAVETFQGGKDLSIFSTRYAVKSFCLEHPVIVTSGESGGSTTTAQPYLDWQNGKTLSVPSDQTWSVFYIMRNDGSIKLTCSGQSYDVNNNRCTNTAGLVQICSEGTFDPSKGTCVVTPETQYQCPEGGRFDTSQDVCIYNPPIQYICEVGDYSAQSGKCEYQPDSEAICPLGTTFNIISKKCEYTPDTSATCPPGTTFNSVANNCEYAPDVNAVCVPYTEWNPDTNLCEYTPQSIAKCPPGTTFNSATNKCEFAPDINVNCPRDSVWNPHSGFCEQFPNNQIICEVGFAYDSNEDKCTKTPETKIICPDGSSFDLDRDACTYNPKISAVCGTNFEFNSNTNECEYFPDENILCLTGSYDSTSNKCEVNPPKEYSCPTGSLSEDSTGVFSCIYTPDLTAVCNVGFYDSVQDICIYNPDIKNECVKGNLKNDMCVYEPDISCKSGSYSTIRDACIYVPDLQYLCIAGEIVKSGSKTSCVITPETTIVCPVNYGYNNNTGKCEQGGNLQDLPTVVKIDTDGKVIDLDQAQFDFDIQIRNIVIGVLIVVVILMYAISKFKKPNRRKRKRR